MVDVVIDKRRRAAAWGVHAFTSIGMLLAFSAWMAVRVGDIRLAFILLGFSIMVDAADGTLARRANVKEVLPEFDGRTLDNLIDFLTFVFIPAMILVEFEMLPAGWVWVAALVPLASGYGFSQGLAKTTESFVGFPSYWSVTVFYLYLLAWPTWANAAIIAFLVVMVFVPIHYLSPHRARWMRGLTFGGLLLWGAVMLWVAFNLDAAWVPIVTGWSLIYPVYYFVVSILHHNRVKEIGWVVD